MGNRIADLQTAINDSYNLITQYERIRRLSNDPKEKERARITIEEQEEYITELTEKLLKLGVQPPPRPASAPPPPETPVQSSDVLNFVPNPVKMRQILTDKFDLNEIKVLCFDLGVDYDDLEGDAKSVKFVSLTNHFKNRDELDLLAQEILKRRPKLKVSELQ